MFFFFRFVFASTSVAVALGLVLQRDDDDDDDDDEYRKDAASFLCDASAGSAADVLGFCIRETNDGFVERKAVTAEQ